MKLLSVTNRFYFISISLFFILAGGMLFYLIRYQLNDELDEQLQSEQAHISKSLRLLDSISNFSLFLNDILSIQKTTLDTYTKPLLFDSLLYDNIEREVIPYRVIRFSAQTRNANYIITIKKSELESSDLAFSIFIGLMLVFGLFSIVLFVSNYYFSKKLWSPFLNTIAAIKNINIYSREASFEYQATRIEEFNELNSSLQQMYERIKSDYLRMKEFSENAAHELQTPLTIIRTKLESLLQSKDLNSENAQLINQALESSVRLSRLNQTLLLLTKIENRQYEQKQIVNFSLVFSKYIELYNEIIVEKKIQVEINTEGNFNYEIHPVLADILVSNILSNAVKHNIQKGYIVINSNKNGFEINNSGEEPDYPTELLFARFKKGNHSPEHIGLGLGLIKEIADTNKLLILYTFKNGLHAIKVIKV